MPDFGEACLGRDLVGPVLDGPAFDFDAATAIAADQVMMMCVAPAPAVERLAASTSDGIDLAVFAEDLKVAVNSGQADVLASSAQFSMDLLGAAKAWQAIESGRDRLGLPGATDPGTSDRGRYGRLR